MVPKLEAAAKDEETCKGIIESMGMTLDKGDAYPDECDYGGCTFNGDEENGENWYFLMKPGGTELPTCDGKPQFSRNRVCACTAYAPGTRPITDKVYTFRNFVTSCSRSGFYASYESYECPLSIDVW